MCLRTKIGETGRAPLSMAKLAILLTDEVAPPPALIRAGLDLNGCGMNPKCPAEPAEKRRFLLQAVPNVRDGDE